MLIELLMKTVLHSGGNSSAGQFYEDTLVGDNIIVGANTIIIGTVLSIIAYLFAPKISKFMLLTEDRLTLSLIIFTAVVHIILGVEDVMLLLGGIGFLAFGFTLYIEKVDLIEQNRTSVFYLLIVYTLSIIIFYIYLHPDLTKDENYDHLGIITKIVEAGIVGLGMMQLDEI